MSGDMSFHQGEENVIYAFWHNRILLTMSYYHNYLNFKKSCVLISESRDGEYITKVIKKLRVRVIRGSKDKNASKAFCQLIKSVSSGYDVWFPPDGPQGPRYKVKKGIIYLAQKTQSPIIPITLDVKRKKIFNSWDKFILPFPFTQGVLIIGKPIYIPPDINARERKDRALRLEDCLVEIGQLADEYLEPSSFHYDLKRNRIASIDYE